MVPLWLPKTSIEVSTWVHKTTVTDQCDDRLPMLLSKAFTTSSSLLPTWKIGWPNICQSSIKVHHVSPRVCLTDLCLSNTQMMCLLKSATILPWSKPPYFGYRSQCQMCYQILWDFKFTLGLHVLISYVGALYSLCLLGEFKVLSYQNKVQCMILDQFRILPQVFKHTVVLLGLEFQFIWIHLG